MNSADLVSRKEVSAGRRPCAYLFEIRLFRKLFDIFRRSGIMEHRTAAKRLAGRRICADATAG
jgi:hypothetical protein